MTQSVTQNAETAEENAERKKKKKKEKKKKKKKRWRSAQDPGRARSRPATQAAVTPRPRSHPATQVASCAMTWSRDRDPGRGARPSSLRGEPRSRIWVFFFFFSFFFEHLLLWVFFFSFFSEFFFFSFLLRTPSSLGFFFFLSSPMKTLVLPLWFFFVFFLNGNRVLETRFPCRRHLEKVPRKRGTIHENRALEARFRSPKSSL